MATQVRDIRQVIKINERIRRGRRDLVGDDPRQEISSGPCSGRLISVRKLSRNPYSTVGCWNSGNSAALRVLLAKTLSMTVGGIGGHAQCGMYLIVPEYLVLLCHESQRAPDNDGDNRQDG